MNRETVLVIIGLIVVGLPGAINTIGNAIEKIAKAKKAVEAPNREQDERLNKLEERMGKVERMLSNDKGQLEKINNGLEASFQVQLALLDHALNGNNIEQMQTARTGLIAYLTHPNKRKE